MNADLPLLTIRFDGTAVGPGKIPIRHLMKFLTGFNKALQQTGRALMSERVGTEARGRAVKEQVALELVSLAPGSSAAVLGFEWCRARSPSSETDQGPEILESALSGLSAIQEEADQLPVGCDSGVLMAWRDAGGVFNQGIERIEITSNTGKAPRTAIFTAQGFARIRNRIQGPRKDVRTIEGRLLMADFKEHGTRCRIHPSLGEPVLCLFDEAQREEVLEDILQYVRIVGEAEEDRVTRKITSIKIHDIERLEDREEEAVDLLPQGTPVLLDFWESPTLDELAEAQDVKRSVDVRSLFGTWPGDADDGFEESVDELRHSHVKEGGVS